MSELTSLTNQLENGTRNFEGLAVKASSSFKMQILEMVCTILKEFEGLASKPVLENGALSLRNNQFGQPALTNGNRT